MNRELPDVQAGFRKGRGTRDQIANIIGKARKFQKNIYFCFIDYAKAIDYLDHNKLWKILKEMGIPDHLTCLLRNLYAGQGATVTTRPGNMDWLDLLEVLRTLKSLLQHHSSKASTLWCSAFFIVQLSHLFVRRLILKYLRDFYKSRTKTKTVQSKNGQKY